MTWLIRSGRLVMLVLCCFWWSGCSQPGESARDEEKDPNYLAGRSRRAALNYTGALEAFESALEANPRSAAAHLELGLIYYQNLTTNWARAIYHFEKYLELRPKANNADLIRQNIDYCKLALAKEVPYTPNNDLVRREVERLSRDNSELRQQIEQLKGQLALRAGGGTNAAASLATVTTPNSKTPAPPVVSSNRSVEYALATDSAPSSFGSHESARPASASRSHVIQSGETPYSIAGKYGVKVASLLSVNPGLDPRRLRPGQTLVLPSP